MGLQAEDYRLALDAFFHMVDEYLYDPTWPEELKQMYAYVHNALDHPEYWDREEVARLRQEFFKGLEEEDHE